MNNSDIGFVIGLLVLLFLSAFFSATETAFSTYNRIRMKNMASDGNKRAKQCLALSEDFDQLLSTVLIGNNIVNIAAASLATVLFIRFFGDVGVSISTGVMTILVLIFGEITPKSLAKDAPEAFSMFATPFIRFLSIIFLPLNYMFSQLKNLLSKLIVVDDNRGITEDELITMVEEATHDGGIEQHEGDLIRNAIEFNDLDVSDVLTPRTEITAISDHDDAATVYRLFEESGYSRLPVYHETIDNIIGVLHLKDFLFRKNDQYFERLKPVIHTTDSTKISKLLPLLQEKKTHLAVVADEYGGTMGIITLEDIVEEIVGEIWDEHDDIINEFEKISETEYEVTGNASLEKLERILDVDIETDSSTVNGWVTNMLGQWPKPEDSFMYKNIVVEVKEVEAIRAKKVRVTLLPVIEEDY